jgi:hypothetical protein
MLVAISFVVERYDNEPLWIAWPKAAVRRLIRGILGTRLFVFLRGEISLALTSDQSDQSEMRLLATTLQCSHYSSECKCHAERS